jgi:mannose-6-phosphate isomerase-like protein (cupin superfamily)
VTSYSICSVDDAPDVFGGKWPGEMKMLAGPLGTEQVAFTYRTMPQHSGGKGGYGHRHKTQEEVYFVVAGELQFKLDDEVVDVGAGTAVRIAPATVRSVWNERPEEAVLIIVSTRGADDPGADVELVEDFWPV